MQRCCWGAGTGRLAAQPRRPSPAAASLHAVYTTRSLSLTTGRHTRTPAAAAAAGAPVTASGGPEAAHGCSAATAAGSLTRKVVDALLELVHRHPGGAGSVSRGAHGSVSARGPAGTGRLAKSTERAACRQASRRALQGVPGAARSGGPAGPHRPTALGTLGTPSAQHSLVLAVHLVKQLALVEAHADVVLLAAALQGPRGAGVGWDIA